jgi:hypothetical protein
MYSITLYIFQGVTKHQTFVANKFFLLIMLGMKKIIHKRNYMHKVRIDIILLLFFWPYFVFLQKKSHICYLYCSP